MGAIRWLELVRISLRANWLILLLVALHMAATVTLSRVYGFDVRFGFFWQMLIFAATYAVVGGVMVLGRLARRPQNPLQDLIRDVSQSRPGERIAVAFPALFALSLFGSSFGALKSAIPQMHPYTWDATFAAWDVAIHGQDAWKLIHPYVGHPWITALLNAAYHLWLLGFNVSLVIACALAPASRLRKQFLIAFILSWGLLGNLAATLLASVGPCFAHPMLGDGRYDELMAYLHGVAARYPLPALNVQAMLLQEAQQGAAGLGLGISAMPSMHVSISVLLALGVRRLWPNWQWIGWLFMVIIFLGSVHLGYHYAVDGYLSLILTPLIWMASGWLAGQELPAMGRAVWRQRSAGQG